MPTRKVFPATRRDQILKSVLSGERTTAQVAEQDQVDGAELVTWLEALNADKRQLFRRYEQLVGHYGALAAAVDGQVIAIPAGVAKGMRWRIRTEYPAEFASGSWDQSFQDALAALLPPGGLFFDVGANAGFHALVGAKLVGERGHVVCFEPLAGNCDAIRDAIAINELTTCEVVEVAVTDSDGPVEFFRHSNNGLGSLVALQPAAALQKVEVPGLRLDTFARAARTPHVLKVDVEGAEDRVLAGAEDLLGRADAPALLLELHSPESATNVLAALERHGFVYAPLPYETDHADPCRELLVDKLDPKHVAHVVALKAQDARLEAFRRGSGARLRWNRSS